MNHFSKMLIFLIFVAPMIALGEKDEIAEVDSPLSDNENRLQIAACIAAEKNDVSILKIIMKKGAKIDVPVYCGMRTLLGFVEKPNPEAICAGSYSLMSCSDGQPQASNFLCKIGGKFSEDDRYRQLTHLKTQDIKRDRLDAYIKSMLLPVPEENEIRKIFNEETAKSSSPGYLKFSDTKISLDTLRSKFGTAKTQCK